LGQSPGHSVFKSIGMVGGLAALGYLASMLRDALLAAYYGGSAALDVYFVALSPAQFLGTEAATLAYLAFLPEFTLLASHTADYRGLLRARLAFAGTYGLGAALMLGMAGAVFTPWLAPGYAGRSAIHEVRVSVAILSLLVPGLALAGVLRAALEARAHFSPWALVPGLRSAALIALVLLSARHPALAWLLGGSLLGVAVVIGYEVLIGRRHGHVTWSGAQHIGERIAPLPSSLVPLIGAILLGAVTSMVDNAFASRAGVGGVQAFALASNLQAAPLNIIGGGVATVFFPLHGGLWLNNKRGVAFQSLWRSVRLVAYGLLPVVVVFVLAGMVVVRVVYKHGVFTEGLALQVGNTLAGLALGQVFYATMVLLRQFLLVAGLPWAVFQAAAVFLVVKWIGNLWLLPTFGLPGIALASSAAALTTCAFLLARVLHLVGVSEEVVA
jgi:putative peptidoglycan lipid II flippase